MFYLSNPYCSFPYCILSLVLRLVVVVVVVVYDNDDDGVVIAIYIGSFRLCCVLETFESSESNEKTERQNNIYENQKKKVILSWSASSRWSSKADPPRALRLIYTLAGGQPKAISIQEYHGKRGERRKAYYQ